MQYIQIPVFGVSHLHDEIKKLGAFSDTVRSIVFLNCGGALRLNDQWFSGPESATIAYVIDSHRPFYHFNVVESTANVICINDGCQSFQECPTDQELHIYE